MEYKNIIKERLKFHDDKRFKEINFKVVEFDDYLQFIVLAKTKEKEYKFNFFHSKKFIKR